jgi:hypothetical protein
MRRGTDLAPADQLVHGFSNSSPLTLYDSVAYSTKRRQALKRGVPFTPAERGNVMTFEEFEEADGRTLRAHAKECFEYEKNGTIMADFRIASLLEAQFYMQERDRRENSRVSLRDFRMERWVIVLIGLEIILALLGIWLTIREAGNEDTLMKSQNTILTNLQQSSASTAKAIEGLQEITKSMSDSTAASARTLASLVSTTQGVNRGVHDQLSLFYDPSVTLVFDQAAKRLTFANTGRTSVTITSAKGSDGVNEVESPRMVAAGSSYFFDISSWYSTLSNQIPKGSTKTITFSIEIKNELGKAFTMISDLVGYWDKDTLVILVHPSPLQQKQ